jgi:hypothetical protein
MQSNNFWGTLTSPFPGDQLRQLLASRNNFTHVTIHGKHMSEIDLSQNPLLGSDPSLGLGLFAGFHSLSSLNLLNNYFMVRDNHDMTGSIYRGIVCQNAETDSLCASCVIGWLQGTIPRSFFAELPGLSSASLSGNWINGTIPDLLPKALTSLDLSYTELVCGWMFYLPHSACLTPAQGFNTPVLMY